MEIIISGLDGLSRIPWQAGKPLTWYVTVVCPLANSHFAATRSEVGLVYLLGHSLHFSVGCHRDTGSVQRLCSRFLSNLGRKIFVLSGDDREARFLILRISVLIHRFSAILLHDNCQDPFPA